MNVCLRRRLGRGLVVLQLAAVPATAHEYWIQPDEFTPEVGETVEARLLVGQMMQGTELPWLSHQVESLEVVVGESARALEGLEGDLPAISFRVEEPGLHVIAHTTYPLPITFETLAEFEEYLAYEGLSPVVERHRERGLADTGISESYARAAKALLQAGPVREADIDRPLGLPFEIVALGNPYAGSGTLPVRLLWQGEPEAGAQVSIFREGDEVERTLVRTDSGGRAEIPLGQGGRFVLNAVHVEPVEGEKHSWASTWASLSFAAEPTQ